MNSPFEFKQVSAKSIAFFLLFVSMVNLILAQPLIYLGLPKSLSFFISTGLAGTAGLTIVLTLIEAKVKDKKGVLKRLLLSAVICISLSYLLIYKLHFTN
ncbi:hypothetical protein [Heyndrickxia acidicola]|uniref:Group-specific protein n=1 Tax=Heyndrickxia acidicola TaxID=209389 RepID=A0ABU6MFG0_9BACI|nr:hypothetical protein [Heyndrickxia acidicola]MED1202776.1 hypothetical protein [Heyndrickxia acidicola]